VGIYEDFKRSCHREKKGEHCYLDGHRNNLRYSKKGEVRGSGKTRTFSVKKKVGGEGEAKGGQKKGILKYRRSPPGGVIKKVWTEWRSEIRHAAEWVNVEGPIKTPLRVKKVDSDLKLEKRSRYLVPARESEGECPRKCLEGLIRSGLI